MVTRNQQQEDMVNTFVASIPAMQTDIALLKQDTTILKDSSRASHKKSDMILDRLDNFSAVSPDQFEKYKVTVDKRFAALEEFVSENKPGVTFASALVNRWTTFLILLLLLAAFVVGVGRFVPIG